MLAVPEIFVPADGAGNHQAAFNQPGKRRLADGAARGGVGDSKKLAVMKISERS